MCQQAAAGEPNNAVIFKLMVHATSFRLIDENTVEGLRRLHKLPLIPFPTEQLHTGHESLTSPRTSDY